MYQKFRLTPKRSPRMVKKNSFPKEFNNSMCKKCSEKFTTTFLLNPKITKLKTTKPTSKNSNNLKLWKKKSSSKVEKNQDHRTNQSPHLRTIAFMI